MNQGHPNQAIRCFRVILDEFFMRVRARNPKLEPSLIHVQPRNLHELPPDDCDIYLSTGGPGTPYEHDGEPWLKNLRHWYDRLVDRTIQKGPTSPALFGVCYTFELLIRHFAVSGMERRASTKFGVMPIYMTPKGIEHSLTHVFGDRLFSFEHRNWEAIDLDERRLRDLGGSVLARESRDGESKGRALLALEFAPGIEGTQFHPEADRGGVIAWLSKREQAEAFVAAYGHETYDRMIHTLDNPNRLARTFALMIPGWLTRKFNLLAYERGWKSLEQPQLDMATFAGDAPPAHSVRFDSLIPPPVTPVPRSEQDDEAFEFPQIPTLGVPTFEEVAALESSPRLPAVRPVGSERRIPVNPQAE